ncbi:MAG: hypothetical protein CG439_2242, partial [Methylococcaceae bacterium NSP1-2]
MNKQTQNHFEPLDAELPTVQNSASVVCPR